MNADLAELGGKSVFYILDDFPLHTRQEVADPVNRKERPRRHMLRTELVVACIFLVCTDNDGVVANEFTLD